MGLSLEDNFEDILGKAQRGLGLQDNEIIERAGISGDDWAALKAGDLKRDALLGAAAALDLNATALLAVAQGDFMPNPASVEGLGMFTTRFNDMLVNAYIAWDRDTRGAVIFDSGADATEMLDLVEREKLKVRLILLTHTHGDHIFDLDRLREKTGASVYVSNLEPLPGAESFEAGKAFEADGLRIETRLTSGHSKGGITYIIDGLSKPVAIVGDSIFAGSMGGGMVSYEDALRNNREQILPLPEDTVLCPGHGPMTTVGEEKRHNPFFA